MTMQSPPKNALLHPGPSAMHEKCTAKGFQAGIDAFLIRHDIGAKLQTVEQANRRPCHQESPE